MSDKLLERRRAQNRDAQRRYRQRQKDNEKKTFPLPSIELDHCDVPLPGPTLTPRTEQGGLERPSDDALTTPPFSDHHHSASRSVVFYGSYTLLDNVLSIELDVALDQQAPGKGAATFSLDGLTKLSAGDTSSLGASTSTPSTEDGRRTGSPYASAPPRGPEEREKAAAAPPTSALHVAAQRGRERIVRTLLQNGAPCDLGDHEGRTPLMLATMAGHQDAAAALLAHGARVEAVDHARRSALHWAVVHRREALLVLLLARRADPAAVDAADSNGETPLHLAINADFEPAVQALLLGGASMMI